MTSRFPARILPAAMKELSEAFVRAILPRHPSRRQFLVAVVVALSAVTSILWAKEKIVSTSQLIDETRAHLAWAPGQVRKFEDQFADVAKNQVESEIRIRQEVDRVYALVLVLVRESGNNPERIVRGMPDPPHPTTPPPARTPGARLTPP